MLTRQFAATNEQETAVYAAWLAQNLIASDVLYLQGALGAGKTTFMRYCLRYLGWSAKVKSPTYTLVETYALTHFVCHHFDLYRLSTPEDAETLGMRDYVDGETLCCYEWPEKGLGYIPKPTWCVEIVIQGVHRVFHMTAFTAAAEDKLRAFVG